MNDERWLSGNEVEALRSIRERGRKSLYYLCTELLGYTDVDPVLHAPFIEPLDALVADVGGTDHVRETGECIYVPGEETLSIALEDDAFRRYMLLAFRGSLKTSVNTIAHIVQLILNFPHIAILLYHNTEDKAKLILHEIVTHFESKKMQDAYPEFAIYNPNDRRRSLSQESKAFTSPARKVVPSLLPPKKEATVTAIGLGSSAASQHVSVIKMTDVVEDINSQTLPMREKVYKQINMAINLLEDPRCLVFLEGTPYQPGDAYDRIIQTQWYGTPPLDRSWFFTLVPAYDIETYGEPRTFDLTESTKPWKVAKEDKVLSPLVTIKKGDKVPMWPTWRNGQPKFTPNELEKVKRSDVYQFACQQLLRPTEEGNGPLAPGKCFHEFPASELYRFKHGLTLMAVDTAETENPKTSNDTAMSVAKVLETGTKVITDGFVGMLEAEEIVDMLFAFFERNRPDIIFLEETSFVRGLKPTIRLKEGKNGYNLPIEYLGRKPSIGKAARIRGSLRIPMVNATLMFSTSLRAEYIERVRTEMSGFPRDHRNDVLDTLADISSAREDLTTYSNPKFAALAMQHERQEAMKVDFEKWVDVMCGRAPMSDEESVNELSLGF